MSVNVLSVKGTLTKIAKSFVNRAKVEGETVALEKEKFIYRSYGDSFYCLTDKGYRLYNFLNSQSDIALERFTRICHERDAKITLSMLDNFAMKYEQTIVNFCLDKVIRI